MAKTKHLEGTEECPTHIIIMSDVVKADICKQHQSQYLSRHFYVLEKWNSFLFKRDRIICNVQHFLVIHTSYFRWQQKYESIQ